TLESVKGREGLLSHSSFKGTPVAHRVDGGKLLGQTRRNGSRDRRRARSQTGGRGLADLYRGRAPAFGEYLGSLRSRLVPVPRFPRGPSEPLTDACPAQRARYPRRPRVPGVAPGTRGREPEPVAHTLCLAHVLQVY